jgi:phosphonate transport system substrate-binding protein
MTATRLRWANFLAPNIAPVYEFIARFVGRQLGVETTFTTGRTYAEFESGASDVGFICGLPYVELADLDPSPIKLLAAPVLEGDRYEDRPICFSDVIVGADSSARSFADIKGCSWSYNEPSSHSGHNLTCYRLVELGADTRFFAQICEAGWHQRSIEMVASGEVDASAIDSQILAVELRERPELAGQIKIIDTLGPSTIQPVVAATHLPEAVREDISQVLKGMAEVPEARARLAWGYFKRFVEVADSDYDDIRSMRRAAVSAGVDLATAGSLRA